MPPVLLYVVFLTKAILFDYSAYWSQDLLEEGRLTVVRAALQSQSLALPRSNRDTPSLWNTDLQADDGTAIMYTPTEERATMFPPPVFSGEGGGAEGQINIFIKPVIKETASLMFEEGNSDCTSYSTTWSDAGTSDIDSADFEDDKSSWSYDGESLASNGQTKKSYSFSEPFAEDRSLEPGALVCRAEEDLRVPPHHRSISSDPVEPLPFRFSTGRMAWDAPWNKRSEVLSRYHRNQDFSFTDRPTRTIEEMSNDVESLLTAEIVREVQILTRFVKRYERKRDRQKRKVEKHDSPDANRSIFRTRYDVLSDTADSIDKVQNDTVPMLKTRTARDQSTQTSGSDTRGEESNKRDFDESSTNSSDSDNESVMSVPTDTRLGIDPLDVQTLGFSTAYLAGQLERQDVLDLWELTEPPNPKGDSAGLSMQNNNVIVDIGSMEPMSSLRTRGVVEEWTPTDPGGSVSTPTSSSLQGDAVALQAATTISPRHQNSSFSDIVTMFEGKKTEAIFPPAESWRYTH